MKILIVNPPSIDPGINRDMAGGLGYSAGAGVVLPPLDLLSCASTLRKHHKVMFVDAVADRRFDKKRLLIEIAKKKFDCILGNLSLPTLEEDTDFYKEVVKSFPKVKVFVKTGINYPEILKIALERSGVEKIIYSECDLTVGKILSSRSNEGCAYLKNGELVMEPLKSLIENLDELPLPSRDLTKTDKYKYVLLPGKVTTMQTSRGCPYPCRFYCPYPLVQGTRWRHMSADRVIREVKAIKKLKISNILFRDATFSLDMERTKEICQRLIDEKIKIKWWCETRANVLSEELMSLMKKAGCMGMNVGVETLDENLIKTEGKPGVTIENVTNVRDWAKNFGLKVHFLMMVGLPSDKVSGLRRTFNNLVKLNPETIGFTVITPYPGTQMFEEAKGNGYVKNFKWEKYNGNISNMRTKYLSGKEIKFGWLLLSAASFFLKKSGFVRQLGLGIISLIFSVWSIKG